MLEAIFGFVVPEEDSTWKIILLSVGCISCLIIAIGIGIWLELKARRDAEAQNKQTLIYLFTILSKLSRIERRDDPSGSKQPS